MFAKTLSFVMALLMFSIPLITLAQYTGDAAQAIIDAKKDANAENQHAIWGAAAAGTATLFGCIGGSVILGLSIAHKPEPPIERLLGKSPEYITFYTKTYQETVQKDNQIAAISGCIGGTVIAAYLWSRFYPNWSRFYPN